jgi:DNA-binding GntR family transcriptional regulator
MAQVQGRRLLDAAVIAAQHSEMLDAVAAGEGERAADLLVLHLSSAEGRLVEALGAD